MQRAELTCAILSPWITNTHTIRRTPHVARRTLRPLPIRKLDGSEQSPCSTSTRFSRASSNSITLTGAASPSSSEAARSTRSRIHGFVRGAHIRSSLGHALCAGEAPLPACNLDRWELLPLPRVERARHGYSCRRNAIRGSGIDPTRRFSISLPVDLTPKAPWPLYEGSRSA